MRTDYEELLRRAVAALPENTEAARQAVYARARTALEAHLRTTGDGLSPEQVEELRARVEAGIDKVERDSRAPRARWLRSPLLPVLAAVLVAGAAGWGWLTYFQTPSRPAAPVAEAVPEPAPAEEQPAPVVAPEPVEEDPEPPVTPEPVEPEPPTPAGPAVEEGPAPEPEADPAPPAPEPEDTAPVESPVAQSDRPVPTTPDAGPALEEDTADAPVIPGARSTVFERKAGDETSTAIRGGTEWEVSEDGDAVVGRAVFPGASVEVEVLLRRNEDPDVPADYLMEVTFSGGRVAGLEGVLVKDLELVPGKPLTTAVAKVTDTMFIAAFDEIVPSDPAGTPFSRSRWIDLAVVYGDGELAVVSLGKDEDDVETFARVLAPTGDTGTVTE